MIEEPQLILPNVDAEPGALGPQLAKLPRARRVFVNRSLRMDHVEWVGFDMDYTLAIYRQDEIEALSIAATVKKLVDRGYPPYLAEARYETRFPMRGLFIDKRHGNVLKMDRYKYVGRAWHGMRELPREERHALYHARKLRVAAPRFHWIDTLYALPEAALYAGAVEVLERYGANVDYAWLFNDIRECIDEAHRDGSIVDVIARELDRFVERDDELGPTLHKLRSAGKKLFLLTNSRWSYTDNMMRWLLRGALPEYPTWRQYFDAVVCAAAKPVFFTEKRPLMERLVDLPGEPTRPAYSVERGRVYEGGNLKDFERMIDAQGDRVLYVGDHIFGDILRSKKDSSWRTVMIIQEMDHELEAMERNRDAVAQLDSMARRWTRLEDELRYYQSRHRALARANGRRAEGEGEASDELTEVRRAIDALKGAMRALDQRWRELERQTDDAFHPWWGSLFKQGAELSSFGDQVEEYACLYTSRVSNLLAYSPAQYFRSPRDLMPHEMP
ncbi:MAG: HAD-IG family 5'-nucleotidase [Polyangiales bacterium]